jgi:hypothetical protein
VKSPPPPSDGGEAPDDGGEAVGLDTAELTLTFGRGPRIFQDPGLDLRDQARAISRASTCSRATPCTRRERCSRARPGAAPRGYVGQELLGWRDATLSG